MQKISHEADVPLATTFRMVKKLLSVNIINAVEIGKFTIYKIDDTAFDKIKLKDG